MNTSRSWAEVDLDALTHNLTRIRHRVGARTAILLVAKADAYGHGAVEVARHALGRGIEAVCVATSEEGRELREAGIRGRILALGAFLEHEGRTALELGIEVVVASGENGLMLEAAARRAGKRLRVHLKVDTGMHRLGVETREALAILGWIQRSPHLELAGLMTHVAATEGAHAPSAQEQLARFDRFLRLARGQRLVRGKGLLIHAESSACAMTGPPRGYDAVRVGIAAYGISPDASIEFPGLEPVLSVHTSVVQVRSLAPGQAVGYGGTWRSERPARVAILPVGYDDGVDWRLSTRGSILVGGRRVPFAGRISMDYASIDVTEVADVRPGTRATLIGRQGNETIGVQDWASWAETIPYAILCSLGKRVRRQVRLEPDGPPARPETCTPSP